MGNSNYNLNSVILDVDGVLWIAGSPGEGASIFLEILRRKEIPFCLLTNDCSVSKAERYKVLSQSGLILNAEQLITAVEVTNEWLINAAVEVIMYLGSPSALPDFAGGFHISDTDPVDAVVLGDIFSHYDKHLLDRAAKAVLDGATLVAMQRNTLWFNGRDLFIDNGFWVAGLEYVTGQRAIVTGKPNRNAYLTAVNRLKLKEYKYSHTVFVSDDINSDLKGAKELGLTTCYFGSAKSLPSWIDFSVSNLEALATMFNRFDHD